MQITDTIADLLTRIRNASSAKHATVDVPASNMKKSITQILVDEGYIKDFKIICSHQESLHSHNAVSVTTKGIKGSIFNHHVTLGEWQSLQV